MGKCAAWLKANHLNEASSLFATIVMCDLAFAVQQANFSCEYFFFKGLTVSQSEAFTSKLGRGDWIDIVHETYCSTDSSQITEIELVPLQRGELWPHQRVANMTKLKSLGP